MAWDRGGPTLVLGLARKSEWVGRRGGTDLGTHEDDGVPPDQVPHAPQETTRGIQEVDQQHHQRLALLDVRQLHAQLLWQNQATAAGPLITWDPHVSDTRHHGPIAQLLAPPASHGPPVLSHSGLVLKVNIAVGNPLYKSN